MLGETFRLFFRSFGRAWFVWFALVIVATGTNVIDLAYPGSPTTPVHLASLVVRALGITWITAAAYRGFAYMPPLWAPDSAFWKYFLLQIGILVLSLAFLFAMRRLTDGLVTQIHGSLESARMIRLAAVVISVLVPVLLTLRITPWLIAVVLRDRASGFMSLWRGMRGNMMPLVATTLVIVVPLFLAHFALTVAAQKIPASSLLISLFDGPVSAIELALLLAATAAAYLRARPSMPERSAFMNAAV